MLYGPGNSQPHKTAPCGEVVHGKGGGFDVHALKSHSKKNGCGDEPPAATVPKDPAISTRPAHAGLAAVSPSTPGRSDASPSTSGGVRSGVTADENAESAVLGSLGAVSGGTLPFTGFSLWVVALVAVALAGAGLTLRRQALAEA
jgi:hypothetical protein